MKETKEQPQESEVVEETIEEKVERLEQENVELKNDFLRARADYENFRKRSQEDMMQARDRAVVSFVEDLLPSIDNFEMSLKMTDNAEMFVKGVEMIHGNLLDALQSHKIESFEPEIGSNFDPHKHDPVAVEKEGEPGTIVGVLKKGFVHKEKVVRPARVEIIKE